jgi:hypothetical protein
MFRKKTKNSFVGQAHSCLPTEITNQHPFRRAIRRALLEAKPTRMMPLVALSLAGLANPALAQPARFDVVNLDGRNGFELIPESEGDRTGSSVSSVGDINGDGVEDLLIGASDASPNGYTSGASYVVFGNSEVGNNGAVELSALDGSNGFVLNGVVGGEAGEDLGDRAGSAVSGAGDVNGDGIDDLLIGAFNADDFNGATYVVFGSDQGFAASIELSNLDGNNGFILTGDDSTGRSGISVSAAGDINEDGIDDLLIGADAANSNGYGSGASYVIFGASEVGSSGSVKLSALDGSNGFVLNGVASDDQTGRSVSSAGDVNGDGVADLLVGAAQTDPNGFYSGTSYVVFGGSEVGTSGVLELSDLDGSNGFALNGVAAVDHSGGSVSAAGDINDDGIDDLLIGASQAQPNGRNSGASYVVFGAEDVGAGGTFELSSLDGNNGFVLNGETANANLGSSVSATGDVNGDGIDDFLIGATFNSFVVFGASGIGNSGTQELSDLDGSNGFSINVSSTGVSGVSGAGDINADGVDDIMIGRYVVFGNVDPLNNQAPIVDAGPSQSVTLPLNEVNLDGTVNDDGLPTPEGLVTTWSKISGPGTVIFGNTNAVDTTAKFDTEGTYVLRLTADDGNQSAFNEFTVIVNAAGTPPASQQAVIELSTLDGDNGFVLNGISQEHKTGRSVSSVGDVNGDGVDDLLIGGTVDESYVVFGTVRAGNRGVVELSELDGSNGFVLNGAAAGGFSERRSNNSGNSVSAAGDVNGDGINDLLIGASGLGSTGSDLGVNGNSYVVFGASGLGASGTVELSALDGQNGFVLNGITEGDYAGFSGYSVSAAGDINGDGTDDLLIGASYANPNGSNSGASYVVFGASEVGSSGTIQLSALDGNNGFVLNGVAENDRSGVSVSAAGDVNADGIDDFLIGASNADSSGSDSGTSYVVFGANEVGSSGTMELSALNGSNGFVLKSVAENDRSGISVSTAGDVNADGIDDLLIGASNVDSNGRGSGASYLVFGASDVGTNGTVELSAIDGSNGFVLNGVTAFDSSGRSVSAAGDINGDGVDDLLIGAPDAFCNLEEDGAECFSLGASYVIFGADGVGTDGTVELSALDGSNGFMLKGVSDGDLSGSSVSTAGDVNNDGIDDLLIGAPSAGPNSFDSGTSYVVFGKLFDGSTQNTTLDTPVSASTDNAENNL